MKSADEKMEVVLTGTIASFSSLVDVALEGVNVRIVRSRELCAEGKPKQALELLQENIRALDFVRSVQDCLRFLAATK